MMTTDRAEWVVEGYRFTSMEDADLARLELEKIKALESRMDYHNGEMVLSVYNRAIMNRTFQTPVGSSCARFGYSGVMPSSRSLPLTSRSLALSSCSQDAYSFTICVL